MKLDVKAFALACAVFWGLAVLLVTWWIILFEGVTGEVTVLGHIYRGYSISMVGSLIGLAWAFVDALICGAVFAWLYNLLIGKPKEGGPASSGA